MTQQVPNPPFNEPPEEVIELLNEVDKGYIGHAPINKRIAAHVIDEGLSYPSEEEAKQDAGDYSPVDNGF